MSSRFPIILVGLPGAGKTTVGRLLAKRLNVDFLDIDEKIEQDTGKTISKIFAENGEKHFRDLEVDTICALLNSKSVLSPGGGAVTNPAIRKIFKNYPVVWLKVSSTCAAGRVGIADSRPLLTGDPLAKLEKLYAERRPFYEEVSRWQVSTDGLAAEEVVDEIIRNFEEA
ncbi:shikimate kinase [Propionimicrobium lymphophilum]|uniref:Shikimate kinase n=1 Tax=Propionimicrobium lymphophilum ACS-093-V-SCH5 TaxID=883161 RepID=S2WYL7_9ACTN|nr:MULTISPECIES: shikimate kinase [Propionimicrobium]EPD32824.1 hypothetical protein HMPREF9306_01131 [Propionimicrobium lymphophilum ACS-093-V-SCH5]ETJ98199.1 putative shikimate kinase [Propionimicrobium sp. BV2F7]MDK7710266.1 shikimate kinase [Propionimicrobium lymphophilum]MDK7734281.1 shikimate kinase [Propionimicrobium lymphophilum]